MYPFSKSADNISWQQKLHRCFIKYTRALLHNFAISIGNPVLLYDHSSDEMEESRSYKLGSFCRHYICSIFKIKAPGLVTIINTVKSRKQAAHMSGLHAKPANPCPNHVLIYSSLRSPSTGTMCRIHQ